MKSERILKVKRRCFQNVFVSLYFLILMYLVDQNLS